MNTFFKAYLCGGLLVCSWFTIAAYRGWRSPNYLMSGAGFHSSSSSSSSSRSSRSFFSGRSAGGTWGGGK